jgi:hypothetical protein
MTSIRGKNPLGRFVSGLPPLGDNEGNQEQNSDLGGHNQGGIQQDVAAGEGINPLRDSLIHLYRSLSLP